ncbi:hypothetical protein, conserved [Babesia bigemina]|uniref:Uncharacterized protein n=1 Tax=Babesia bigemina TaxID=5866 RepID=A0A061D8J0_BABBI|nr:hypothetical protein, conserved [Babesia bigemina]CDR97026.1 hypothetical protein, conserved [Babesia bigemina]|eukprot:XP_012769212.1 hypothetical protein, conserved [Babesia bigemina]
MDNTSLEQVDVHSAVHQDRRYSVESLKESLHAELLSHIDLSVVFLLLLRGELFLYEPKSVKTLSSLLARWRGLGEQKACGGTPACEGTAATHVTTGDGAADNTDNRDNGDSGSFDLSWSPNINRILHRVRQRFHCPRRRGTSECSAMTLSESDYEYCSSCIGREAVGMLSMPPRCVCKVRQGSEHKYHRKRADTGGVPSTADHESSIVKNGNSITPDTAKGDIITGVNVGADIRQPGENHTEAMADGNGTDAATATVDDAGRDGEASAKPTGIDKGSASLVSAARRLVANAKLGGPATSNYDHSGCVTCSSGGTSAKVVAVISPFVVKGVKKPGKNSRRSIKRSSRSAGCGVGVELDYHGNVEMYTSHNFPLNSFFEADVSGKYSVHQPVVTDSGEAPNTVADAIFDVVEAILCPDTDAAPTFSKNANIVAHMLHQKLAETYAGESSPSHPDDAEPNGAGESGAMLGRASRELMDLSEQGAFTSDVESKLLKEQGDLVGKVGSLVPFPTTYWLTDPELVAQVSALEGGGAIMHLQREIDMHAHAYEREGVPESGIFVRRLILDNLAYICQRFALLHPVILTALYTMLVNSVLFSRFYDSDYGSEDAVRSSYISLSSTPNGQPAESRPKNRSSLEKALAIVNTPRVYGIGGSRSFVHIKCLHTNLAFELAEGCALGSLVFEALADRTSQYI